MLRSRGLLGQSIGIYRIVAKQEIPQEIWNGVLPTGGDYIQTSGRQTVRVIQVQCSRGELLARLTFGAIGACSVLDIKLSTHAADFWIPHIIRRMGFFNAEGQLRRFFNYLETAAHLDSAAWDPRSIFARVQSDIRRDFAYALAIQDGGSLSFGRGQSPTQVFYDRLSVLGNTIAAFGKLLKESAGADEAIFHSFLAQNSALLDIYAEATSKPRFVHPNGMHSATGKAYLEPDFVLKFPDGTYRLVELERPSKMIATKEGHPRAQFSQASFQIAEWREFIANHYELIRGRFPGIATSTGAMLIIGRSTEEALGGPRNVREYKATLRMLLTNTDIYTYDELWQRANEAYIRLVSLSPRT